MSDDKIPAIGIFGAGWVGLVTGACFAGLGHQVVIRDIVPERIEALRTGRVPFHEPGLDELLEQNRERLTFTLDVADLAATRLMFVCVGTPPTYSGDADLSAVWTVVDQLPSLEERALPALRALLDLPFERVIVSHGEPVHDRAAYERALELPPWGG